MSTSLTSGKSGSTLLQKLVSSPALPAYVQSLEAPVLKRLIDHVGIADASALIVHSTAAQLHDVFDVVLWESLEPGRPENHRPEKFLEWADALLGAGEAFAGQRLLELGEDFITVNLAPLVAVYEASLIAGHDHDSRCDCLMCRLDARDTPWELIGDYLVAGEHADEWDTVQPLLIALDDTDSRALQRVLARCCRRVSAGGFSDDGQHATADAAGDRQRRRESAGFVTPELAAVFLRTTRDADASVLADETGYDAITASCFSARSMAATRRNDAAGSANVSGPEADEGNDDSPLRGTLNDGERRRLDNLLREGEIIGGTPLLLAAPANSTGFVPELQTHIDRLQWSDPEAFQARLGELVHLANVLIAGARFRGTRFEQTEAARAAIACASLGLDLLLSSQAGERNSDRRDAIDAALASEPGVIRLFRMGWQHLQSLQRRCGEALVDALQSPHLRDRLKSRAWILAEIDSAISDPDLLQLIERGEFEDVSDNLHLLTLILDPRACRCLQTLIADWPQYPVQLEAGFRHPDLDNREVRHLTRVSQLGRISQFLDELDRHLKAP